MKPAKSEAIAEAMVDVFENNLSTSIFTKQDAEMLKLDVENKLGKVESSLKQEINNIRGEVQLLKWMISFLLAGVASLIIKAFF
jgi:hypothetical protein